MRNRINSAHNPIWLVGSPKQTDKEFDGQAIPIPSGVGFCMALSTSAIARVGLMDPVFGRGYSEEIDWCLRSHVEGFTSVLAPSCFVYHAGSGITRAEGLVGRGDHIVHAHQAIIDERYPLYRSQLAAFVASSIPGGMKERALRRILITAVENTDTSSNSVASRYDRVMQNESDL